MFQDQNLSSAVEDAKRADILEQLQILDTEAEPEFDAITRAAAQIAGCKISLISLMDEDRQWFKSRHNVSLPQTPMEWSFCRYAVADRKMLVVENAPSDPRFAQNPLVIGDPEIRFYAGAPLSLKRDGEKIAFGALCVIDPKAKTPTKDELEALSNLARLTETLLQARLTASRLKRKTELLHSALADKGRYHRQLQQAERLSGVGSWRLKLGSGDLKWSPQVFAIHEVPEGSCIPVDHALDFFPEPDRSVLVNAIEQCTANGQAYDLELQFITARNRRRRVRAIGELELLDGKPEALIGVFQDVTDRYEAELSLRNDANSDELTNLASRRGLNRHLDQTISDIRSNGRDLVLLLLDLDNFKKVNDTLGHGTGDETLRQVADKLQSQWLRGSFAARLGGDEFVLLIEDPELLTDLPQTLARLLTELQGSIGCGKEAIAISASIGATLFNCATQTRATMLKCADHSLYRAKEAGRNKAVFANRLIHADGTNEVLAPESEAEAEHPPVTSL